MAKRTRNELLSLFEQGDIPTHEDFRDLIDSTFSLSDLEFYSPSGKVTTPIRLLCGETEVAQQGYFEIRYSHVPHTSVVGIFLTPKISTTIPVEYDFTISADIKAQAPNISYGRAFISGYNTNQEIVDDIPAPNGTKIQYLAVFI